MILYLKNYALSIWPSTIFYTKFQLKQRWRTENIGPHGMEKNLSDFQRKRISGTHMKGSRSFAKEIVKLFKIKKMSTKQPDNPI